MEKQGILVAPDAIRFERTLNGSLEKVWSYVTESDKRGKWLATGEMELFEGGKVDLFFLHEQLSPISGLPPEKYKGAECGHHMKGKVLEINPPYLLSFTWEDDSAVTIELSEAGNAVQLILTHRKLSDNKDVRISLAGGWHTHLDFLVNALQGKTSPNFWVAHAEMEEFYSSIV
jgi:uncharacterized protein YndB with AHSA1/START domain